MYCKVKCEDILFTAGMKPNTLDICLCEASFHWNETISKCHLNCSSIMYATGELETDFFNRCFCEEGFFWEEENLRCVFDCPAVANTTGL